MFFIDVAWYTSNSPNADNTITAPCENTFIETTTCVGSATRKGVSGHFSPADCPVLKSGTSRTATIHFSIPDHTFYVHEARCEPSKGGKWWPTGGNNVVSYVGPLPSWNTKDGYRAFRRATITIVATELSGKVNKFGDARKIDLKLTDPQQLETLFVGMRLDSAPTVTKADNVLVHGDAIVVGSSTTAINAQSINIPSELPAGTYHIYVRSSNIKDPFTASDFVSQMSTTFSISSSLTFSTTFSTSYYGGQAVDVRWELRNVNQAAVDSIRLKVGKGTVFKTIATKYKSSGVLPNEAIGAVIPLTLVMGTGYFFRAELLNSQGVSIASGDSATFIIKGIVTVKVPTLSSGLHANHVVQAVPHFHGTDKINLKWTLTNDVRRMKSCLCSFCFWNLEQQKY